MVGVLVDTCVVSALQRPERSSTVLARVAEFDPDQLFPSVITVGEVAKGIARLPIGARRQEFAAWLLRLEQRFPKRILAVDSDVARRWGELSAQAQATGVNIPIS